MVQVVVGPDKKPFTFHKKLIRRHSEYFSRAFGPRFKEGEENTLYLAEADETSCLLFQSWIYLQTARSLHPVSAPSLAELGQVVNFEKFDPASFSGTWIQDLISENTELALKRHLIGLYIFADAYECMALRNDIMSAFMRLDTRSNSNMGFDLAPLIFGSVPSSSTLCRYIVRSTASHGLLKHYNDKVAKSQPQEFKSELLAIGEQRGQGFAEGLGDPCNFHEHAKDEEMRLCDSVWLRGQFYIDALISACMEVIDAQSSN
ncbi:hypothetical protein AA0120_g8678 [Alternaria tenuissima]|nr:hypothetical protein AA0120_g8678 [Alternaria tenuissima]